MKDNIMETQRSIGFRIKCRRKELKMTQAQLGAALKSPVKVSTISGYETGYSSPDINTIISIASALDCTVDDLIFGEKSAQTNVSINYGERIKKARLNAGITQKELASRLGVPFQSVSQWERGVRNPKMITLRKISSALSADSYIFENPDLIRTKRYLDDEIASYQAAEKINGYMNESQKEAYSALYTARLCVERVMDELEIEVK